MSIRRNLILVLLASFSLIVTGCPKEDDDPNTDGGVSDAGSDGGVTDGGGDGGTGPVLGESCELPFELTAGTQASGDSTGAADDFGSACADGQAPNQPDVVYHFTLSEPSGLEIVMTGFDGILILFKDACTAGSEVGACVDQAFDGEAITVGLADPGEYFLVVDGYDAGGAFTLDLTVTPGGVCLPDGAEGDAGNETAATAAGASSSDLDTRDLGDPQTPEADPFPLNLCEGDVDYFVVGHLGGDLHVGAGAITGAINGEVFNAVVDPTTGDLSEGTSIGTVPQDITDAARGYYFLKVDTAATPPPIGTDYFIEHTHGCQGDADDQPLPEDDDEVYARAVYGFYDAPGGIERSLCLSDKDVFVLQNLSVGDITVSIVGGGTFVATVEEVVSDGSGGKTTQAYAGTVTPTVTGADLEIALPAAPVGEYLLTLALPQAAAVGDTVYTLDAIFAGMATLPANDTCETAETLVAGATPTALNGRTIGATDHLVGPCGGEEIAVAAGSPGANDVFYGLNIPADTALEVAFDGSITRFFGQVYLLELPGASCPADLSTLTPVTGVDGSPACRTGTTGRIRLQTITAGDYLVVVDGIYQEAFFIFPEEWTEGGFSVSATTFAGGLPEPAACTAATALTLPASGASSTETFDNTGLVNSLDSYGTCPGGTGFEKVFEITPTADATVTITAEGYDTVLAINEADCEFGTQVTCNDDNDPPGGRGSQVTANLVSGTTYFLIVDGYSASSVGTATVTIEVQ